MVADARLENFLQMFDHTFMNIFAFN